MRRTKEQLLKILLQHGISDMEALVHASPGNTQVKKDLKDAKKLIPEILAFAAENERLQRQIEDTAKAHANRCAELNELRAALENEQKRLQDLQSIWRDQNEVNVKLDRLCKMWKHEIGSKDTAQAPEVD